MAEKRGSELVFQDVRARRRRRVLSAACLHCARSSRSSRRYPRSPWWAVPASGTRDQQRHARETQAPGCPQRAHGECGLWARAMRKGGHTQGGAQKTHPAGPSKSSQLSVGGRSWAKTAAGSGIWCPHSQTLLDSLIRSLVEPKGMRREQSGHRLLVQHVS